MVYEYSSSPNLSTRPRLIYCLKQIYPEDVVVPCSCRRGRSKTFCHAPSRQITNFNFVISRNTLKSCHEKFNIFFSYTFIMNIIGKRRLQTTQSHISKDVKEMIWFWRLIVNTSLLTAQIKQKKEVLVYNISFLLTLWNINRIE